MQNMQFTKHSRASYFSSQTVSKLVLFEVHLYIIGLSCLKSEAKAGSEQVFECLILETECPATWVT